MMQEGPVKMTESAAQRICFLLEEEQKNGKKDAMLRVAVAGGGCSGFQYIFDFETVVADDDILIIYNGARVVIDESSLEMLKGSILDFVEELIGSAFKIDNPNAASGCGCGSSFSIG